MEMVKIFFYIPINLKKMNKGLKKQTNIQKKKRDNRAYFEKETQKMSKMSFEKAKKDLITQRTKIMRVVYF